MKYYLKIVAAYEGEKKYHPLYYFFYGNDTPRYLFKKKEKKLAQDSVIVLNARAKLNGEKRHYKII